MYWLQLNWPLSEDSIPFYILISWYRYRLTTWHPLDAGGWRCVYQVTLIHSPWFSWLVLPSWKPVCLTLGAPNTLSVFLHIHIISCPGSGFPLPGYEMICISRNTDQYSVIFWRYCYKIDVSGVNSFPFWMFRDDTLGRFLGPKG